MRGRRLALAFLALASPAVLGACWWAGPWGEIVFALLVVAFPVALIVLGAAQRGRLGPLRLPLVALGLILEGSLIALLLLRGRIEALPWVGGLPLVAAIQVYCMALLPLGLVALAYALTFESFTLRPEDLDRLRRSVGRPDDEDGTAPPGAVPGGEE